MCDLEELDLSDLRYISDLTFNRLTGCTPRLRRLSLAGCHIAFEFDPYRGCPAGAAQDSSALLSLRNLLRLLTEQRGTLAALDLSRTSIGPESLRSIAQVRLAEALFGQRASFAPFDLVGHLLPGAGAGPGGTLPSRLQGAHRLLGGGSGGAAAEPPEAGHQRLHRADQQVGGGGGTRPEGPEPPLAVRQLEDHGERCGRRLVWASGDSPFQRLLSPSGLAELLSLRTLRRLNLSECLHVSGTEMAKGLKGSGAAGARLEALNLNSCIYIRVGRRGGPQGGWFGVLLV